MKRLLMILLTVTLAALPCIFFATCSKKDASVTYSDGYNLSNGIGKVAGNATIISADVSECTCCGGYFISIDGQKPIAGQYFRTHSLPGNYTPAKYPVRVLIEWEKAANPCINDLIVIKKMTTY